ncbi:MAG TPA: Asp-tRNA(Asn)/Glu-tRNA(Gln) amidotransferase subunit GatC [bacterium]|nr:Asp-tRNA(Asn)/Glu-tRNA(Gln) amidotransferase subunit GatC [bacterium]HOL66038.1 Asp-tRNA(Asn)/Glu-tRNA(Gln) amidotransferase subunit GatC [bacterium]HPP12926.1 Asp-tRNA(Asn)/Glu-tRNA(Gln) amidotransferase subunit GatC [bacterium]
MKQQVKYLAELARIALTEQELAGLEQDLEKILDYVSQLEKIETTGVEPTYHVVPMTNVWRQDKVEASLSTEKALANAPERHGNFFKVPRVI